MSGILVFTLWRENFCPLRTHSLSPSLARYPSLSLSPPNLLDPFLQKRLPLPLPVCLQRERVAKDLGGMNRPSYLVPFSAGGVAAPNFCSFPSQRVRGASDAYRALNEAMRILLSRTQAVPGRAGKQEQEEISPNHVPTTISGSV